MNIYTYNDLRGFNVKLHNVKSNLCTFYYRDKNKFCGNYCSRKPPHGFLFNKRCWRHKKPKRSAMTPPVILLLISASERTYNRDTWLSFMNKCEDKNVPLELVIYHEDMYNCTVRNPHNLVSRFRPFPEIFGNPLPLRNLHGSLNFTQVCNKMLDYGCKIPYATRCILLTERTIPIRSPLKVYNTALSLKCYINISYNVAFGPVPYSAPRGPRGRPYSGVNHLCQGLYTTELLREALPTLPVHCETFGISLKKGVYTVTNNVLFDQWRAFTGANPSEFWLLNSFLLEHRSEPRSMDFIKSYMTITDEHDKYFVAEIPQWRDNWKRTFVFRNFRTCYQIPVFDQHMQRYYRGVNFNEKHSLLSILRYLKGQKHYAMFFRQVELP